jgi:hypothetical protein
MTKYKLTHFFLLCITNISLIYALPAGWRPEVPLKIYSHNVDHFHAQVTTGSSIYTNFWSFSDEHEQRCYEIPCNYSADSGVTWFMELIEGLSVEGLPVTEFSVDITARDDTVHAVYIDCVVIGHSPQDIRYAKSTDGGANWGCNAWISCSGDTSAHPAIALKNNDTLYISYAEWQHDNDTTEIYFSRSTNGGSSWHDPADTTQLNQRRTVAKYDSWLPDIAANDDYIHLVWADNRISSNYEIYYNRSTNSGVSWSYDGSSSGKGYRLTTANGESTFPDMAIYSDSVYVVWEDNRPLTFGIYYKRSTNNGTDWGSESRLNTGGGHPSIAADSNGVYVVWHEDGNLFYKESTNGGVDWGSTVQITAEASYYDSFPDIAADGLGRHIVFERDANDSCWYIQRDIIRPAAPDTIFEDILTVPPPVILHWRPNSDADINEYCIYRSQVPGGRWSKIGTSTDTTYTDNSFPRLGCYYAYTLTAVDLASNESDPCDDTITVWVPNPGKRINCGEPLASPYNIQRDGYYGWGASFDSTADFGDSLKYRITGLVPKNEYVFGFALFEPMSDSGRVLSIEFESQSIIKDIAVPESTLYKCFVVPEPLYSNGVLDLGLNVVTDEAVLSQILIWERTTGGPQYLQSVDTGNGFHLRIYPNPVMKTVGIEYNLPKCTDIELSIFDINGRLVEEISAVKKDAGIHTELFDITRLSQGVYFIRLKTTNHSEIQKVIFVK